MKYPATRLRKSAGTYYLRILRAQLITALLMLAVCVLPFLVRGFAKQEGSRSHKKISLPAQAPLTEFVRRGSVLDTLPINPRDARELPTRCAGVERLCSALEQNVAQPLSLASADFDEDGVPDLASGYSHDGRGIVSVLRGNVDSIYPNSPEAKQREATGAFTLAPFLAPAHAFELPVAADFIGAGDFDADGHWDVVAAARGTKSLSVLAGDGHGNFGEAREIELPGTVKALVTGEINRADGLTDVVVALDLENGSQVLVFEGPAGALKEQPEVIPVPSPVTSLALAQLSRAYTIDLAIAAGSELLIVRGRDRKLSLPPKERESVQPMRIERRSFPLKLESLAVGRFNDDSQSEIALLLEGGVVQMLSPGRAKRESRGNGPMIAKWPGRELPSSWPGSERLSVANFSGLGGDELLLLDPSDQRMRILRPARGSALNVDLKAGIQDSTEEITFGAVGGPPLAVLPMQLDIDALTDLVALRQGTTAPTVVLTTQSADRETGPVQDPQTSDLAAVIAYGSFRGAVAAVGSRNKSQTKISTPTLRASGATPAETSAAARQMIQPLAAACSASPITLGQTINGSLATTDCFLNDGNYVDLYSFTGTAGQQVAITLNSTAFDAFLYLLATDGSMLASDDDGGISGTNAQIPTAGGFISLPANGTYTIYATSLNAREVGPYSLTLTGPGGGTCPATPIVSGPGISAALTTTDCRFNSGPRTGSYADIYTFTGFAGQQVVLVMASTTFDTYLYLIAPDGSQAENDDADGFGNSRIPATGSLTLPANGVYTIYATSFDPDVTGSYAIGINLTTPPPAPTVVTNTNDSGPGSLRQAILNANSNQGVDTISFNVPSPRTISPLSALPEITDPVVIDGTTQPGFSGTPMIELDGRSAPRGTPGLQITAGSSRVRGLVINRFGVADCNAASNVNIPLGSGILLASGGSNIIEGNFIGTDLSGTVAQCNSGNGIFLFNSSGNIIGGTTAAARNIVSGNRSPGIGIGGEFSLLNIVQGNYIGTDVSGNADVGNRTNGIVVINGTGHLIGGTTAGARNLVSGNDSPGIGLGFSDPAGVLLQGNYIGTNAAGTAALPNLGGGVIVGGFFQLDGTPITATDNTIGGTTPAARNVISGNLRTPGDTNLDAGNGIEIINAGSQRNKVQGNYIGLNANGTAALPNTASGVFITRAPNNIIGGDRNADLTGTTNYIAGNGRYGVGVGIRRANDSNPGQFITGGNRIDIVLNVIGSDITGTLHLGNGLDGVYVDADSVDIYVNGNIIAYNGRSGVRIPDANGILNDNDNSGRLVNLDLNLIHSNAGRAIDLGFEGLTPNDLGDADGGANLQQNFPVLNSAAPAFTKDSNGADNLESAQAVMVNVNGTLNSSANTEFTVHWYFSGAAQCVANQAGSLPLRFGRVPQVKTGADGNASFVIPLDLPPGINSGIINCSATDPQGNTSEFSSCFPVNAAPAWQPVVLTAAQVSQLKAWTVGGRTYVYVKPEFPNAGYRVTNWGQAVSSGDDFTADASVEKFAGPSIQSVVTTAQIYDLGPLAIGTYNFNFKTSGTLAKTLTFTVSSTVPPPNPIDTAREFVKQQYRDFLNREADTAGENFWTDNITKCSDPARRPAGQTEAQCTLRQRETTSGAFFLSPEFQYTGYYVYRMYQGALGRQPKLSEFISDAQFVGNGIIVGGQLSAAKINQNKADFAAQFVNCTDATKSRCAEFKAIYDGLNNQQYVDKLFLTLLQTAGVNASAADKAALVSGLDASPAIETRATVLQKVVDGINVISEGNQQFTTPYGQAFYNAEFNEAFVLLEYFGYMKRDPDDAGYAFWLGKLNQFGGNFVNAEMVLAFVSSPEYRARFGQP